MKKALLFILALFVFFLQGTMAFAQEDICRDAGLPWYLTIRCKLICNYTDCMDSDTLYTSARCVRMVDKYIDKSGELPPCIVYGSPDEDQVVNELYCYANMRMYKMGCELLFDPSIDDWGVIDVTNGNSEYERCLFNMMALHDMCLMRVDSECFSSCEDPIEKPCYDEYDTTKDDEALSECLAQVQDEIDACFAHCHDLYYFDYPPDDYPPVIE